MLAQILESFEKALDVAESADVHQKTARKLVGQIDSLVNAADALPDELRPTLPTAEEVEKLRALTATIVSPELTALKSKVEAALMLGADAGLVDFDEIAAKTLMERYTHLISSVGTKRSGTSGRTQSGIRTLTYPMRLVFNDPVKGKVGERVSGNRSGGGDWTWVRWQITDHAKDHDGVPREALDAIRLQVQAVENGQAEKVEEVVVAGDGFEYEISYPA